MVITGASKGVGRAAAISFARAGCSNIALAARSRLDDLAAEVKAAAKAANRLEPQVLALEVDVSSESSVAAAAEEVSRNFGSLDVLINNAGYLEEWKPISESSPRDWYVCLNDFSISPLRMPSHPGEGSGAKMRGHMPGHDRACLSCGPRRNGGGGLTLMK